MKAVFRMLREYKQFQEDLEAQQLAGLEKPQQPPIKAEPKTEEKMKPTPFDMETSNFGSEV